MDDKVGLGEILNELESIYALLAERLPCPKCGVAGNVHCVTITKNVEPRRIFVGPVFLDKLDAESRVVAASTFQHPEWVEFVEVIK